jgi:hypothetical protein
MGKVLIDESTLTNIADSIRSKKGTTDLINPANYASEISGITGGDGSSIENGFTVNFHDAENNLIQSTSAIYGYQVYAPVSHMVDHWEDENGKLIQFPLTVNPNSQTNEINVYESGPGTCERLIYAHFGISKTDYGKLLVSYNNGTVTVYFSNGTWNTSSDKKKITLNGTALKATSIYSSSNSASSITSAILKSSVNLSEVPSGSAENTSIYSGGRRLYTNFGLDVADGRLEETIFDDGSHTLIHPYALQEKTVTTSGEVVPDDGYYGLSKVIVNI